MTIKMERKARSKTGKLASLGLAGVLGFMSSSCTDAGGRFLADTTLYAASRDFEHKQRMEEAQAGRSQVDVTVQTPQTQQSYQTPVQERIEFFTYTKHIDLNNDGYSSDEEYFGKEKTFFDIKKEEMHANLRNGSPRGGTVIFKSFTENGELVGESRITYLPWQYNGRYIGPNTKTTEENFLDMMQLKGSGKYILTATLEDDRTFRLEREINVD